MPQPRGVQLAPFWAFCYVISGYLPPSLLDSLPGARLPPSHAPRLGHAHPQIKLPPETFNTREKIVRNAPTIRRLRAWSPHSNGPLDSSRVFRHSRPKHTRFVLAETAVLPDMKSVSRRRPACLPIVHIYSCAVVVAIVVESTKGFSFHPLCRLSCAKTARLRSRPHPTGARTGHWRL